MKSLAACFTLFSLALFTPPLGAAAGEPSQTRTTVEEVALGATSNDEEYNELRQSVALLAGGGYASVWTEQVGQDFNVRMQWVRPDGSKVFADGGRSVASTPDSEFNAVVASNPAGGAFVAFSRYDPVSDWLQVHVQSYDAAGNPRWAARGVFATTLKRGDVQDQTQLVAAPDGGVYLCMDDYHEDASEGSLSDILCQRFDAGGRRLWSDQGINAGGLSGWKVLPKLVRDVGDGVMVFWRNNRDAFHAPQDPIVVEGQHLAADGASSWGPQGEILRTSNLHATQVSGFDELSAAADGQGGAVVSFDDWDGQGEPNLDVFAQRVTGEGILLWGEGAAVAALDEKQQNDSIVATLDGGAFVTVRYPDVMELWLYRLGPGGKVRWKQQLSSTDSSSQANDWGAYGSFDQGRLRIAWIHQRQYGTDKIDVYLAVFDPAGHRLNGTAGTPVTSAPNEQLLRGFVFDPARRQGFAVWEDDRKGNTDDFDAVGGLYRE
jgi:hypothetical protein